MPPTPPSISKISWTVKRVIADRSNVDILTVRHSHSLSDVYGYTPQGKMDLAPALNAKFAQIGHPIQPQLHPTDTQNKATVGDLVLLVRSRF